MIAARRRKPFAAREFSDGVALSWIVLRAHDERFGVDAGGEDAAVLVVGEQPDEIVGDGPCLAEPGDVVDLGQREECLEQCGVVLGVREEVGAPALPRTQEATVVAAELAEQEAGVGARGLHPVVTPERERRLGERAQEQRVPSEQHLVVEPGTHAVCARRRAAGAAGR